MQADDGDDDASTDIHVSPVDDAARSARQAAGEGGTVFVYKCAVFRQPNLHGPLTIEGQVIEAIEGVGWGLEHMAYHRRPDKRGVLVLLFRRALGERR
jgi:hypothetical protein